MTVDDLASLIPRKADMTMLSIRLDYDFEPHGRASETWEDIWTVSIPEVRSHWMSTNGWKAIRGTHGMLFRGHTLHQAVCKAGEFMQWYNENARDNADGPHK